MSEFSVSVQLKKRWKKDGKGKSLRQFATELVAAGDDTAKQWFKNKDGALNKKRSDANIARAKLERDATRSARRKNASKRDDG